VCTVLDWTMLWEIYMIITNLKVLSATDLSAARRPEYQSQDAYMAVFSQSSDPVDIYSPLFS
jgi:hypothetical protein